ncbi:MAG: PAS domain-containing protein, partial [Kofleriaceae bacterium]
MRARRAGTTPRARSRPPIRAVAARPGHAPGWRTAAGRRRGRRRSRSARRPRRAARTPPRRAPAPARPPASRPRCRRRLPARSRAGRPTCATGRGAPERPRPPRASRPCGGRIRSCFRSWCSRPRAHHTSNGAIGAFRRRTAVTIRVEVDVTTDDVLLSGVIDQLPLGVWIARAPGGELLFANQVFREILGIEARGDVAVGGYSEPYGIMGLDGKPYPEARMPFVRALEARATVTVEDIVIHRHDGRRVNIRATARPIFDGDVITHIVIAFADYTAEREACARQREAEERARQDERLQAIGTLAAGVAHDFNNVLAQIRILASMLRVREQDASRVEDLVRIEQATDSAAALTRSLLAFGRHPAGNVVRFDLDAVVAGVVDLVRRTFERHITIEHRREPGAFVAGDQNQLEQVILNLAVNARDAMANGGTLTFA